MWHSLLDIKQLAFLAGLVHDIGKLSLNFIKSKEPQSQTTDFHGQILWQDRDHIPDNLWNFLNFEWTGHPGISIAKLVCSHHGCQRCLGPARCAGLEDDPVKKTLQTYDRCDTSNPADSGKQLHDHMEMTQFLGETIIIDVSGFDQKRFDLYKKLDKALADSKSPTQLLQNWTIEILKATKEAFCETRKHSTDLTLGAHLLSTAILFSLGIDDKPILCTSMPASDPHQNGFAIGCNSSDKAILTCTRNGHRDEVIFDKFTPFDEFIWLEDALPEFKPNVGSIIDKCRTWWVKQPEDIEQDYTFEQLTSDIDRLKNLAKLSYAEEFEEKKRAWGRHLKNLHKAESLGKLTPEYIEHTRFIEQKLEQVNEMLSQTGSVKELLKDNDWQDCHTAYEWAWFFLSKTMSPIRPTSPVTWARRILDENPFDSKESAVKWVLGRRLTLGRWLSINLSNQDDEGLEKFIRDCLPLSWH